MNLLDALRADDTPAGKAALHDYLLDHDVPQKADESKVVETVRAYLQWACTMKPPGEARCKINGIVEVRMAITPRHASVTFYSHGKRILRVGQDVKTFGGDVTKKAQWAVKSLYCETTKRILSSIDV
jgi:hypothetical protein